MYSDKKNVLQLVALLRAHGYAGRCCVPEVAMCRWYRLLPRVIVLNAFR